MSPSLKPGWFVIYAIRRNYLIQNEFVVLIVIAWRRNQLVGIVSQGHNYATCKYIPKKKLNLNVVLNIIDPP